MEYKKSLYLIIIIEFLILVLVGLISFNFLSNQIRKTKEKQPEIMAQYNVNLEVTKFRNVIEKLRHKL